VAATGGRSLVDPSWRRWSFSAITRTLDQFVVPPPPVMGGADEPSDEPSDLAGPAVGMPWVDLAGGTSFGTLVHAVLERIDPTSPTLAVDLHDAVWAQLRSDRLPVDADVLIAGLTAALHTPLGPALHGRRLADLAAGDRLAEMTFDLPLAGTRTRFSSRRIGEVLVGTLAADDPQLPYARSLAEGRFDVQLAGFLQGSIDAVLRVGTPGEPRFVVVDYKTNRLHQRGVAAPLDAYHPDLLPEAMAHHDYPLQALLYSVAVHRYLRWRMPAYDPATHLGGVAYLFLRGMVGEHTPTHAGQPYGVFSWRPAPAAIEALDRLLATGGVA
jgi:exodeoxyribonuclease V beta subunit